MIFYIELILQKFSEIHLDFIFPQIIFGFILSLLMLSLLITGFLGSRLKYFGLSFLANEKRWLTFIFLIILIFNFYHDLNLIYCEDDKVMVTADNLTVNVFGFTSLANSIGQTASFTAGISAAAKLLKNKSYPLGFKFLLVGGSGVGSLILMDTTKRIIGRNQEVLQLDVQALSADSSNTKDISTQIYRNGEKWDQVYDNFTINSPLEPEDISNHLSELIPILYNSFLLNNLMILICLLAISFFTFKFLSDRKINLEFLKRGYLSNKLVNSIYFILNLWSKTNIFWGFTALLILLIFLSFNSFFLNYLVNQLQKLL